MDRFLPWAWLVGGIFPREESERGDKTRERETSLSTTAVLLFLNFMVPGMVFATAITFVVHASTNTKLTANRLYLAR